MARQRCRAGRQATLDTAGFVAKHLERTDKSAKVASGLMESAKATRLAAVYRPALGPG